MKRGRKTKAERERGAALVTVLTMVSIMSALAIVAVDAANMGLRRTANLTRMEQTRWYLMGAEAFAASKLAELNAQGDARIDRAEWLGRRFTFPLDDGVMAVSLQDGGNCFNLNALVQSGESGEGAANMGGVMQFALLMDNVGVRADRIGLGAALADWIDADAQPLPGGLESGAYPNGAPYRPANALLGDVSELRRVRGFSPDVLARLGAFVCVRPSSAPNRLNPNTLTPDQAPLLATAIPDISVQDAQQIIRDRPRGGWADLDAFFDHPRLVGLEQLEMRRAAFTMDSAYYVMRARVERDGASETEAALIRVDGGAGVVVRRLFGVGRAENPL